MEENMKKLTVVLAVLLVVSLALTGCTKKSGGDGSVTRGMNRQIIMGVAQVGAESEWRNAETLSILEAATDWNVDLRFADGMQKQENQIQAIRTFIRQKVDIIVLMPVVETGFEAVLQEAKDAKIPVMLVDRTTEGYMESPLITCFVGADFVHEGNVAAEWVINYLNKIRGNKDPINIVELQGTVGASAATGRMAGFKEVIDKNSKFRILRTQTGNFTRAEGKQVMEAFLKSDGDAIDVVFAHNDDMAIGAIQAIEEFGRKPGTDIVLLSIDAAKGAFSAVVEGTMNCVIECNPVLGPLVMETAVKILNGQSVPKWVVTEAAVYDQTNAAAAFPNRKY
jgi:simple sugar transport system substrate-binding protein